MPFQFLRNNSISLTQSVFQQDQELDENCTISGIDEFPNWFTDSRIRYDYVILCFLLNMYLFLGVAIVCDEYCVPSVERLCYNLGMSYDVAGATFLDFATASPEFFVHCYATFLTEGDMGIGTIVGSATFNALAVMAVCGFSAGTGVFLDWWPLSRDLLWYTLNIILLTICLQDGLIYWYEALMLFISFLLNMSILIQDGRIQNHIRDRDKPCRLICFIPRGPVQDFQEMLNPDNSQEEPFNFYQWPVESNGWVKFIWTMSYPWEVVLCSTIPNVRREYWSRCYILGLTMSIIWISVLAYFISWMLTVVGYYLQIPDSVVGITFIAVGASIPEAISSVIVIRKGYGSMAVCNAIGSNNLNIAFCLAVPWLCKTIFVSTQHHVKAVAINSASLFYSTSVLIASCLIIYGSFLVTRFELGFKVGLICLITYLSYISMAVTLEMLVFKDENLAHCPHNL